ncbi:MAG TPA: homoserine kinase [Candidatus Obscuribacterales bacterium]
MKAVEEKRVEHKHNSDATSNPCRRLTISVPGSTTNLGPGFDSLGLALSIYSRFTFQVLESDEPTIPRITLLRGAEGLSTGEDNLVFRVLQEALTGNEALLARLRLTIETDIPLARGLGSSSTAILSALWASRMLTGGEPSRQEVLTEAAGIEGHPDNVAASLLGGLIVSAPSRNGRRALTQRLAWPEKWRTLVVVPGYGLSTEMARRALPKIVPLKEAVANVQRTALLVAAIANADDEALAEALEDRLHEPYRSHLVPELSDLKRQLKYKSALGCVLSGAGSSILVIVDDYHKRDILSFLNSWAAAQAHAPAVLDLSVDMQGLRAGYDDIG